MLTRTHFVFGVFVGLLLMRFNFGWLFFGFLVLGSVFVDIDSRKSRVGKRWWLRPLQWFVKHRGFFHSLVFALLFSLVVAVFNRMAGAGFFVGYVSHLFLDVFTRAGVKVFWPLEWKIKGFIKSGGLVEEVLFVLLLLVDIFLIARIVL